MPSFIRPADVAERYRASMREKREKALKETTARRGFELQHSTPLSRRSSAVSSQGSSHRRGSSQQGSFSRQSSFRSPISSGRDATSAPSMRRRGSIVARLFSHGSSLGTIARQGIENTRPANFIGVAGRLVALSDRRADKYEGAFGTIERYDVAHGRFVFALFSEDDGMPTGEELLVHSSNVQPIRDDEGTLMSERSARSARSSRSQSQTGHLSGRAQVAPGTYLVDPVFPGERARRARAEAASRELITTSAVLLACSPYGRRSRQVYKLDGDSSADADANRSLHLLTRDRLLQRPRLRSKDDAPFSDATKEGPPRPWEMRATSPPAPPRPPAAVPVSSTGHAHVRPASLASFSALSLERNQRGDVMAQVELHDQRLAVHTAKWGNARHLDPSLSRPQPKLAGAMDHMAWTAWKEAGQPIA